MNPGDRVLVVMLGGHRVLGYYRRPLEEENLSEVEINGEHVKVATTAILPIGEVRPIEEAGGILYGAVAAFVVLSLIVFVWRLIAQP